MAKKHYIQLPKGYLSYSAIALWLSDPKRYADVYFDDRTELRTSNRAMEYGKVVADALEHGIETGDLLTDAAMLMLPKYDVADQEMIAEMKTKDGWVKLLGRPDTLDSKTFAFGEYKTGRVPWTQAKAQKHLQLALYATIIYLKHGVVPSKIDLIWIETVHEDGKVVPTGRVESFPVTLGLKDILETMTLVTRVAKDIEVAYAAHVPNLAITRF